MAKKKERKGLVFLMDQMVLVRDVLEPEEQAQMYSALYDYGTERKIPDLNKFSKTWRGIFELMKKAQDESKDNYGNTCEQNRRNANKRWHNECDRISSDANDAKIREDKIREDKIREDKRREDKRRETTIGAGETPALCGQEGVTEGDGWW